ncbi:TetR/AcrR family transcriptional regulator [Terricaulis silvestris]|uniref:Tetracycline repressor protein class A n=1 Tax=Terricaulis silvestris TaxID=2686094 RepID=A0A6I6MQG6_9CAUL|nr:TetR/AcrR family transcriptional regulator [Terricaulis silvestris]QGZ93792.1 Tetracycline repressor protein class A [Terricaulis silvestris]
MGRPKQALISRRRTLEVALRIIDEEGLEALSIRRLGDELNVRGISLYHHFKSKEHILVGVCELALSDIRTPNTTDTDWREWFIKNAISYWRALLAHPNLIPVLMRRHPLRIGLAEHNATAGLLAVQGVPPGAIMPILEGLEALPLGCAIYESAVEADEGTDNWKTQYPFLFHVSQHRDISRARVFEVMARAALDAILAEYEAVTGKSAPPPKPKKDTKTRD